MIKQYLKLLIIGLILISVPVKAQNGYPEPEDLFVNDYADVINQEDASEISNLFSNLKNDTGIEATVLTIDSINDYPTEDNSIESFATNLFNTWGIGDKDKNNGVLILVAVEDRKVRIEVGAGYENTQNKNMQEIINEFMLPNFRKDKYSEGIYQGSQAIVETLTDTEPTNSNSESTSPPPAPPTKEDLKTLVTGTCILGGVGLLFLTPVLIIIFVTARFGKKMFIRIFHPKCPNCKTTLQHLDEKSEDIYLDSGQQLEETLKSINYHVWLCNTCNYHTIKSRRKLFSSHKKCPQCQYRTVKVSHKTLDEATYTSTGEKQITKDCKRCDYHHEHIMTIPRLTRTSSSSSDSSSFGGGSSSGGGASGSW